MKETKEKNKIKKRVKKLCDVLEIDHIGLITEGVKRLMDKFNKMNNLPSNKIDCKDCPFGNNECGWARCPTKEEWEAIGDHFFREFDELSR